MTYQRNQAVGSYGERLAAAHLRSLGMAIIATNWRCDVGEIDIVARDGSTIVIVEVKTRTSYGHGGPFEAITGRKAQRLRRLAVRWLHEHDLSPDSFRIDVVSVVVPPRGKAVVERISGVA
jgi:putative endonuclease